MSPAEATAVPIAEEPPAFVAQLPEPIAVAEALVGPAVRRRAEWTAVLDAAATRALDIVVSLLLLVLLVPFVLLIALAIKVDSRGPTFFRCERMGYRGRRLMMLKFRKMRDGAHGRPLTLPGDDRFTRVGAWLARLKLDEIPQLVHVLRGEMSLVGPRPECPRFADCYSDAFERILSIRPGMIGLSQLAFFDEGRILDGCHPVRDYVERILPQKLEMDLFYLDRRSFWFNLRILAWSSLAVLLRQQIAVDPSTGRMSWRRACTR